MIVYEEYASPQEKRRVQRGARLACPTGKARGYFFAFNENGRLRSGPCEGGYEGRGNVFHCEPGTTDTRQETTSASMDFLRRNYRQVGGKHLKGVWRQLWLQYKVSA